MNRIEQKVNDQVFYAWDQGFLAGQKEMIQRIFELGLINDEMASLLKYAVNETFYEPKEYITKNELSEFVKRITKEIMEI